MESAVPERQTFEIPGGALDDITPLRGQHPFRPSYLSVWLTEDDEIDLVNITGSRVLNGKPLFGVGDSWEWDRLRDRDPLPGPIREFVESCVGNR